MPSPSPSPRAADVERPDDSLAAVRPGSSGRAGAASHLHPVLGFILGPQSGAATGSEVAAPILSLTARRWLERMRLGLGETTRRVVAAFEASGGRLERRAPGAPGLSRSEAALLAAFEAGYRDRPLAAEDALTRELGRRPGEDLMTALMADCLAHCLAHRRGGRAGGKRAVALTQAGVESAPITEFDGEPR